MTRKPISLLIGVLLAGLVVAGCIGAATPSPVVTLLASASTSIPTIDPTKITLEIEATAMSNFITQQAATLWPPTETPPAAPLTDPSLGIIAWTETIPFPNRSAAALHPPQGLPLIFHNGYVYIFGGRGANDERFTSVYFSAINPDGTLAGWRTTTSLPGKYVEHVEVKIGNYVYMITGADSSEDVYYTSFNPDGSIGAWKQTAPLSPSRQTFAVVSYGNFIYAAGGNSGGPWERVQYTSVKPDGSLYPWMETTPLPVAMQEHTMIAYNGHLYIFGGKTGNDKLLTTVYFSAINPDGTLAGWQAATPLPRQMYGYGAFETNGYVYLMSGDYSYFTRILENHALDLWQSAASLPAIRYGLRVGAHNGYAYAVGGYDFDRHENTVYFGSIGLRAEHTVINHPDCTSGWTRLTAGGQAKVSISSLPNEVRTAPDINEPPFALLPSGSVVQVIEGPICTDGFVFWKVAGALISGGVGWTAEGDGMQYYLEPIQ